MPHARESRWLMGCLLVVVLLVGSWGRAEALTINELSIDDVSEPVGSTFMVQVLLTSDSPVEGVELGIGHDPTRLNLIDVNPVGVAAAADFVSTELLATGLGLGIILDLSPPFGVPPSIPAGTDQIIVEITYEALAEGLTELMFLDGVLGSAPFDNLIVIGGLGIGANEGLILTNGVVDIGPIPEPTTALLLTLGLAGLGMRRRIVRDHRKRFNP